MKSMDRCGKVHDFLVSGQQNPSIHHGGILDRMRDHVLHRRAMAKIRGHLLIASAGLASLQDAGCRCVFSGGIARWGSTTGYKLPSLRDEEVSRWCFLGKTMRSRIHPEGMEGG
jgi:hypothetical protein